MKEKEFVKQVFTKNKEAYVRSSTHAAGNDLPLMIEWLKPDSTMIALDLATGGGHVAKYLSENVMEVIATDITQEMLLNTKKCLQDYKNINFAIADAEKIPYQAHSFDIVTCRIAAHHFPNPALFIAEVHRVLKPNGQFLFIDNVTSEEPAYDKFINTLEKMRDYSHVRSLQIPEWKQLFKKYGLTVIKQQSRKKILPYKEWVNRTLDNTKEIDKVSRFILDAKKDLLNYHQVKTQDNEIQSFAIDEWMVLCKKNNS